MSKAIFTHNNAYDHILLSNGTCFKSVEKSDLLFFLSPDETIDNWDGNESWVDHGETMEAAAIAYGEVVAIITDDYKLQVEDQNLLENRMMFYRIDEEEIPNF